MINLLNKIEPFQAAYAAVNNVPPRLYTAPYF